MQQIIIIFSAVFIYLQDKAKSIPKGMKNVLIGALCFWFLSKMWAKSKKDSLLNNASTDVNISLAVQLNDAFNPLDLGWFDGINGTDENKVIAIAKQMQPLKNYAQVAEAYQTAYAKNLTEELKNEGVYDLFMSNYNNVVPPTNTTTPNTIGFKKGDKVYTKGGYNLRNTDAPYGVIDSTVQGQDFTLYNDPYYATIAGQAGYWVVIQQPPTRYWFWASHYVVFLTALYK